MATTKAQRIGIWSIAILMVVGSIGSFAIIVLANINSKNDTIRMNQLMDEYQDAQAAQAKELSNKYYPTFSRYQSRVASFDANIITELHTEDLLIGEGETVTADSQYSAYYTGWLPDGTIFQSTIENSALTRPLDVKPGRGMIPGWTQGVEGMKLGGVRELTIPSELAYGENGNANIPPNTPIKFIVMLVPTPEEVEMSEELRKYYQTGN